MTELAPPQPRASIAGFDTGAPGVTPPSNPARRGVFLTDVIVELGFADPETVQQAVQAAGQSGKSVEEFLLGSGILDEQQLSLAIAERNGLDHVDLDRFEVDRGAAEMVSRSAALRYSAVPIAFASDGALIVAVKDPFDSFGINDIEVMTRSEARPVIATASGIQGLIEQLPDEPAAIPPPPEFMPDAPDDAPEAEQQPAPPPAPEPPPPPEPPPAPEPAHRRCPSPRRPSMSPMRPSMSPKRSSPSRRPRRSRYRLRTASSATSRSSCGHCRRPRARPTPWPSPWSAGSRSSKVPTSGRSGWSRSWSPQGSESPSWSKGSPGWTPPLRS